MRMRSFKAGQQQDERDAGKRSEAPEETRSALAFCNHTQACSLGAQKYSIAAKYRQGEVPKAANYLWATPNS